MLLCISDSILTVCHRMRSNSIQFDPIGLNIQLAARWHDAKFCINDQSIGNDDIESILQRTLLGEVTLCLERKNQEFPDFGHQSSYCVEIQPLKCLYKNRGESLQHLQLQELQSSPNHLLGRDTSGLSHTLTKYLSTWHFETSCHNKAASNVLPRIEKSKDSKISKQSEPFVSLECLLKYVSHMFDTALSFRPIFNGTN